MPDAFKARLAGAEQALVAAAVFSDHAPTLLAGVEPGEFSSPALVDLWRTCGELLREHGRLDELVLRVHGSTEHAALVDSVLGLQAAVREPSQHLAEFRAAQAIRRGLVACNAGARTLRSTDFETGRASASLSSIATDVQRLAGSLAPRLEARDLSPAIADFVESIDGREGSWSLSTGIADLDERIGGLRPGTMTAILARSGHGKSSVGVTASLLAARDSGALVLYVTREMPRQELAGRFAAAELGRSLSSIRRDLPSDPELRRWVEDLGGLPIVIEDGLRHIDAIAARVDRERLNGTPYALVVLDYLQVLEGEGREQHERLEYIAYRAKDLAMNSQCAVLAMVQPNRAGSKAEGIPTMHDIRGSSAVENAADSIVSMVRADPLGPEFSYPLVLSVQKARNGRPGGLGGKYELGPGTFLVRQMESEQEASV